MGINANLGTQTFIEKNILDPLHPAIIRTMDAKANNGTLVQGLIVAKDSNGDIVAYDPVGADPLNDPIGILIKGIDTTKDTLANVLRHGTVVKAEVILGDGSSDPADSDFDLLVAKQVYPI